MSFLGKLFGKKEKEILDQGIEKTKKGFLERISKAIIGKTSVDDEVLDQLEEELIGADVGVDTTLSLIEKLQERVKKEKYLSISELNGLLHEEIVSLLVDAPSSQMGFIPPSDKKPFVILVVGVNGVGKTTTIGKLAHHFKAAGNTVILGAADTFRAAAADQLTIWSERVGVAIVKQNHGADPSAVAFDTIQSAIAKNADVVLIDTAGRLHNKVHLMDELNKIKRVIEKQLPGAPHEVLLVLDGSTGQNALEQAKQFMAVTNVNALAITKLDGTAKGGVVLSIAHQCKIPVKYIGVGEQIKDLLLFDKDEFVDSLFK
ncbi:MAG: signal recognition particle-docking protein FtsY [Chitinophagia bacterium]|jgi:fused signal recognition particle receptor|nr:signal recognition particle-docking protein FtsY [Chitinophagia bacterium]NCA30047.1 signal recognition particle-docking protein FtsY [Chitinophagia bacterium]NDD15723.1 signal recognition particle-docking protein FtsY [Chitinophagia bacterium]